MDEKQIEKMINSAASKLGMNTDELKKAAASGDINGILSHMDKTSADKIRTAMNDKKIAKSLLSQFTDDN